MKRTFLFLVVALCFLSVRAQQTSLVIDNQTPGWLSSKIGYADQKTVQNLEITGYLNYTDLTFIGELISKQNLNGVLNLENVYIVGKTTDEDNVMPENAFNIQWSAEYPEGIQISEIIFPLSLTKSTSCLSSELFVDKITIGGEAMPSVKGEDIYNQVYSGGDGIRFNQRVKHLTLREGVTEIPERAFYNKPYNSYGTPKEECRFESVSIPTTVKKVEGMAFHCCYSLKDCLLPDNIEIIESDAFTKTSFVPDTLDLPLNLRTFYTNSFTHKANQVIIIKENVEEFNNRNWYITKSTNLTFVMHCITPPVFQKGEKDDWYSPSYSDGKDLSGCTIYVPKESFGKYSDPTYDSVGGPAGHWSGWVNSYSYAKLQTIYVPATSIEIDFESVELVKGETKQLSAIVLPTDADSLEFNWRSANPDIVSVTSTGLITANSSGEAFVITNLNADSAIVDSCKVKVIQPVTSIVLNTKEKALKVGETYTPIVTVNPNDADNKNIIWTSENPRIAVIENGTIKALKAGVVKIIATSEDNNNATDSCEVVVIQPVMGINLNYTEYNLEGVGSTVQLEAIVLPDDATNNEVNWKSSNENVCIVSNGTVVAVNSGTSVIIATTVDGGYMAVCTIFVQADTGIADIKDSNVNYEVYSLYGQRQNALQRGVNIVVFEDGTKAKVFVK